LPWTLYENHALSCGNGSQTISVSFPGYVVLRIEGHCSTAIFAIFCQRSVWHRYGCERLWLRRTIEDEARSLGRLLAPVVLEDPLEFFELLDRFDFHSTCLVGVHQSNVDFLAHGSQQDSAPRNPDSVLGFPVAR
jgi:hypothetical protein